MGLRRYATHELTVLSFWIDRIPARWRFALFLMVTVLISLILTGISYWLYVVSGTAQLDLSRPGYKQALREVGPNNNNGGDYSYPQSGLLTRTALSEFKQKYDALVDKTKGYSAFDPSALSDEQLNLTAPVQPDSTSP